MTANLEFAATADDRLPRTQQPWRNAFLEKWIPRFLVTQSSSGTVIVTALGIVDVTSP
jgi:hypothetical protein